MFKGFALAASAIAFSLSAQAQTITFSRGATALTFDESVFADELVSLTGGFGIFEGTFQVPSAATKFDAFERVLTDANDNTWATFSTGNTLQVRFVDNAIVNGAGNDLWIFENGSSATDNFDLMISIGGSSLRYTTARIGVTSNGLFLLGGVQINLDDFGLAAGAQVTDLYITSVQTGSSNPAFVDFAAINSVVIPEPSTYALIAGGVFLGFIFLRRRR